MKSVPKTVWMQTEGLDWNPIEFMFLKERDVFTFDKQSIFTASCDAYVLDEASGNAAWSILVINKELEIFRAQRKQEKDKLFDL